MAPQDRGFNEEPIIEVWDGDSKKTTALRCASMRKIALSRMVVNRKQFESAEPITERAVTVRLRGAPLETLVR